MIKPKQTSVVVLITLAELAWLAALGLLFAYRGKDGELHKIRGDYQVVTNRMAEWESQSSDTVKMLRELESMRGETNRLTENLRSFESFLRGRNSQEAAQMLYDAELNKSNWQASDSTIRKLTASLNDLHQSYSNAVIDLNIAKQQLSLILKEKQSYEERSGWAKRELDLLQQEQKRVMSDYSILTNRVMQLETGEVAIRRELTGLPTNELRRVVFVVDTSSSMYNSPAWKSARDLIRTWVEYLSVQECVLINFNDQAETFPKSGYQRVRSEQGKVLSHKKDELLAAFDQAKPGVYSDLLKALRIAYKYPGCDLIVLFTDGQPHVQTASDSSYAADILKEVGWNTETPILAVAVGSYEIEGAGGPRQRVNTAISFLKELAQKTGGSFIGR